MSKWYCRICNRNLNSGAYCVENHFKKKHPKMELVEITDDLEDEKRWNWNSSYMFPIPEKQLGVGEK